MNTFDDVKKFMEAAGHEVKSNYEPEITWQASLYADLIKEEYMEFARALKDMNPTEIADACIDLIWVTEGLMLSMGMPMQKLWNEVARSNHSKISDTGKIKKREDGKILKPDTYSPPQLESILKKERGFINPFSQMQIIGMLIAAAVLSAGAFTTGYKVCDYAAVKKELQQQEKQKEIEEANQKTIANKEEEYRKVSEKLEVALKELDKKAKVITKIVEKEIEKPIYRDCVLPTTGVQLINQTATELNSARYGEDTTKPSR
jgi:predicted HAD superfamily Cof-like phosphohydrolase